MDTSTFTARISDPGFLLMEIVGLIFFKILLELSVRLNNYNYDKRNPGLIILDGLLYLLTLVAFLCSPALCFFDLAVDHFKIRRICTEVEKEAKEEVMKMYHIPPYDDRKF